MSNTTRSRARWSPRRTRHGWGLSAIVAGLTAILAGLTAGPLWAGPGEKMYLEFLEQEHIYPDEAWSTYVQKIGDRLVDQSPEPKREYYFYVVDEPSVNAFALPDAYIFVHRGLIGYLESEDQLAAVIGHEIAHVTKRHSRRLKTSDFAGKTAGIIGALMTGRGELMDVANTVNSPLVMGYKRDLELEADEFGSVYLAKAGYNPYAMIEVIQILKDQETFAKQIGQTQGYHGLFATHPKNDKRLHDSVARSANSIPDELADYEGDFWEMLDGLVFGNEAAAGIVKEGAYYHGNLRFVVEFPEGWDVGATSTRVTGRHPSGASSGMITLERQNEPEEEQTPEVYVTDTLKRANDVVAGESFETSGYPAYMASLAVEEGKNVAVRMIGVLYKDNGVYLFKGEAREGADAEQFARDFRATMETFRAMTAEDQRTANNQRIRVVTAEPGDSYATLAKKSSIRRYPEQTLRLLNGDHPVGEPRAGDLIKVVQ